MENGNYGEVTQVIGSTLDARFPEDKLPEVIVSEDSVPPTQNTPALIRRVREAFADRARLFIMYGQTEASARLSYLPPEKLKEKLGSIGVSIPGVELEIRDGEGRECAVGEVGDSHGASARPPDARSSRSSCVERVPGFPRFVPRSLR